jgi:ABC-type amino acid transport substrate-binding protein
MTDLEEWSSSQRPVARRSGGGQNSANRMIAAEGNRASEVPSGEESPNSTGQIPGLVAKKFDMVSVGLSATPERRKSISFSRPYVPYAQILAQGTGDSTGASIAAWNQSGIVITSLQGSTAEQLVQKTFPNAESKSFTDQNAAFLEVATNRANGIVVENYLLAQFQKSNPGKIKQVALSKPLNVEYGSYGVQKGNTKLAKSLSDFICKTQNSGQLAKIYKVTIGAPLPPMPPCKK